MSKLTAIRPSARLTRNDWIDAAILVIAESGIDAVRIDDLATRLQVTKGSYYWHFSDREALLTAVLETWRQRMTTEVDEYLKLKSGTPMGRLKRLLRLGISSRPDVPGGPLETSLRVWGRREPRVAKVIDEVDARRITMARELYEGIGLSREEAQSYAFAHLSFVVGGRQILFTGEHDDLMRRWALAEAMLIPPALPPLDEQSLAAK